MLKAGHCIALVLNVMDHVSSSALCYDACWFWMLPGVTLNVEINVDEMTLGGWANPANYPLGSCGRLTCVRGIICRGFMNDVDAAIDCRVAFQ